MTIRVLVADDQALVRAGFVALLDAQDGIEVIAEADTGTRALAAARELRPDVVLMDIRMPEMDGLAATREIAADPALAEVRVVVLTTFELDEYVFEAMRAGASGFLVKHTEPTELVRAVRVVAEGDALLSPSVTRRLVSEFAARTKQPAGPAAALSELTSREREVMALVAEGLTNAEIGERLFMSPATARTHVSRILTKLGARDRTQLVVHGLRERPGTPGVAGLTTAHTRWRVSALTTAGRCDDAPADGRLDGMTIYEITPTATTFLAERVRALGPSRLVAVVPASSAWCSWSLVIVGDRLCRPARRGRGGERTLRDAYAKGEVNEAEYRERLAVLRETRR